MFNTRSKFTLYSIEIERAIDPRMFRVKRQSWHGMIGLVLHCAFYLHWPGRTFDVNGNRVTECRDCLLREFRELKLK